MTQTSAHIAALRDLLDTITEAPEGAIPVPTREAAMFNLRELLSGDAMGAIEAAADFLADNPELSTVEVTR